MAFLSREFVAVPDNKKDQIVFKWPDHNLRKGTRAIIEPDQLAVFVNRGQVIGTLGPGRHAVEADELPFLGVFIDIGTGGNAYRAELFFVGTREYPGNRFGGRVDDVRDPLTGLIVTLRVFGEYSLKVTDPNKIILNLTGTVNVEDNTRITGWISEQLLKVMRTEVTRQIVRNGWPILGLSAYTPELEAAVMESANAAIFDYGLGIVRMGNFDVNLAEEDEERLKKLAKDVSYTQLAGGFQQYAAGEALLGAGEGMSQGGGAVQGAFLAAGLGFGQQMSQPQQQAPAAVAGPPPAAAIGAANGAACAACGAANPAGAKFCSGCGGQLAAAVAHCTECGMEVTGKFCSGCGTPRPGAGAGPVAAAPAPAAAAAPSGPPAAPPPPSGPPISTGFAPPPPPPGV
jgi:membrane protease subunit (stomatin/prohibitin family)